MLFTIPIAFTVLLPAQHPAEPQSPLPTVAELVAKLHAPREGITQYEIVIDARQAAGSARPHLERFWRDGTRYRTDHLDDFVDGASRRKIDCTNCPTLGQFFAVDYDRVFDRAKTATLGVPADRQQLLGDTMLRIEDLGATCEPLVGVTLRGIEWWLDRKEWTVKQVERARWNNLPAYKIVLGAPNHPSKATCEVTLLPDRGFAAVSVRSTSDAGGKKIVTTSDSDLGQVMGIWLPKSCVYKQFIDGKLTKSLVQKVEYVRLREAPDPKCFTLAGMDLIPGTLVGTDKGTMKWDGTQLGRHRK